MAWSVNGKETWLTTTFVSESQLTAVIPAASLIDPAVANVSVEVWYKADDTPRSVSNLVDFNVESP